MGRPSKLTESQWDQIGRRLVAGEKAADLCREYGVSKTALSLRFSKRTEAVKDVATKIVAAETALAALVPVDQIAARSLADELKAISMHIAGAAKLGAATAHRLAGIAHAKVQEVDDAAPLDDRSREALKDVAVLQRMANEASEIGMNLIKANKDAIESAEQRERDAQAAAQKPTRIELVAMKP